MYQIARFLVGSNLLALAIVYVLQHTVPILSTTHWQDYLFYTCVIFWGIAKLCWDGGKDSSKYTTNVEVKKAKSMIKGFDFEADRKQAKEENHQFGLLMFFAGIPAFLACIITTLL